MGSNLLSVRLDEPFYRPVVGPLHVVFKKAGRQLFHAPVILYALATDALAAAWLVGAVTPV